MQYLKQLVTLAQQIADERRTFFDLKGPGAGDKDTSAFIEELHKRGKDVFGDDFVKKFAEQKICGHNNFKVDFYFPEEGTIVEVALALRNPNSEFEKDIIKAIIAKRSGKNVRRLVFLSKPGGAKRNAKPGPKSIISWVLQDYKITVLIKELANRHNSVV